MQVQVETNGQISTFHNKDDIEREIQLECASCFTLGHSAPISHSLLGDELRYFSNPTLATQILDGSYPIPDDMDPPTALMIEEMGRIGRTLQEQEHEAVSEVSSEEYQHYFGVSASIRRPSSMCMGDSSDRRAPFEGMLCA